MGLKENKESLYFSVAGGFVAGGSLLAYQILLESGWSIIISGLGAIVVAFIVYGIAIRQIKKLSNMK